MMKKLLLFLCGVLLYQMGSAQGFEVKHVDVEIHIHSEGYFDVIERYDMDFSQQKHGIFREIRTSYDLTTAEGEREKRKIKVSKIKVPGHKYSVDPNFIRKIQPQFQIKIGDKNKWVFGPQHYEIRYRVDNAFLFEESQVQFYWNVKSTDWTAPFHSVSFTIYPPEGVAVGMDDFFVYSGYVGETSESTEFDVSYTDGVFVGKSKPGFLSNYGDSVTVLLKMPPNAVKEITPFWPFWSRYGWLLILSACIYWFYWIWNKFGRDRKVVATTSYFPPKNIDPCMAGFLIDDKSDTQDLIALIPYWGSRGIIRMEHIPKDGLFSKEDSKLIRLKPLPEDSPSYEREMYKGLFGYDDGDLAPKSVLISSLKDSFYTTINSAKSDLKSEAQIYYDPKARKIKNQTILGIILGGIVLGAIFLFTWGLIAAVAVVPVAVILLVLSPYLVKKNPTGDEMLSDLKGFKQFIRVAEENKLKMLLEEDPSYFEATMAYAVAFGMFKQWAGKFESLNIEPPSWYSTTSTAGLMSMNSFSNSFSSSLKSAQTTMISSPSSSGSGGGGSSGGGFGGGGGGSW